MGTDFFHEVSRSYSVGYVWQVVDASVLLLRYEDGEDVCRQNRIQHTIHVDEVLTVGVWLYKQLESYCRDCGRQAVFLVSMCGKGRKLAEQKTCGRLESFFFLGWAGPEARPPGDINQNCARGSGQVTPHDAPPSMPIAALGTNEPETACTKRWHLAAAHSA